MTTGNQFASFPKNTEQFKENKNLVCHNYLYPEWTEY